MITLYPRISAGNSRPFVPLNFTPDRQRDPDVGLRYP